MRVECNNPYKVLSTAPVVRIVSIQAVVALFLECKLILASSRLPWLLSNVPTQTKTVHHLFCYIT